VLDAVLLDMNEVVDELEHMIRHLIGEDVRVSVHRYPIPLPVVADRGQLLQVLVNLAINARDAMPAGGELSIACESVELDEAGAAAAGCPPGVYSAMRVSDTGAGMDELTRTRAFEPFFTTKEPGRGTGLGLATSYGIVTQSGGTIAVESQPGAGTTVTILLPEPVEAPPRAVEHETLPEHDADVVRGSTVLLVEDEPLLRELLVEMLASVGVNVLAASDADEAVAACEAHPGGIDALVSDLVMPGISGRELAAEIGARHPGVRVLYISGYSDEEINARGLLEPGMSFLQKPFTVDVLEATLGTLLTEVPV